MIRVTVWNEYVHEREYEGIAKVYPKGIHGCIADFLGVEDDITVTCATLDMENQGISGELLKNTDVLIWWSHCRESLRPSGQGTDSPWRVDHPDIARLARRRGCADGC